jgi:hypothetical protein
VGGAAAVYAFRQEDHLNHLNWICEPDAEWCSHHGCVGKPELPPRLAVCDQAVTRDAMNWSTDVVVDLGDRLVVAKKRLADELPRSRDRYRCGDRMAKKRTFCALSVITDRLR